MKYIELSWKEFKVNLDKVHLTFKLHLSANYDGLVADEYSLRVIFLSDISSQDSEYVNNYWNTITAGNFAKTMQEVIQEKIDGAIQFGAEIILQAIITNITLGITQAGKTRMVSDYLRALQRYLREGSLYAAIEEIDELISQGVPSDLAPFVTEQKLQDVKTKIQSYLVI